MWIRDLHPTHATDAAATAGTPNVNHTVPESQAYPGLQKAVLVEPQRQQQMREMVERLCDEMVLMQPADGDGSNGTFEHTLELDFGIWDTVKVTDDAGETIQLWDWRVAEDVVQHMLLQRSRLRQLPSALALAADEATRMDIEAQIQIDAVVELEGILKKSYLGCVAWCRTLGRNVWIDAGLARVLGAGAGLNGQVG